MLWCTSLYVLIISSSISIMHAYSQFSSNSRTPTQPTRLRRHRTLRYIGHTLTPIQQQSSFFSKKIDTTEEEEKSTEEDLKPAYLALSALLVTFVSNQWCRQSIYYLCDFSKSADSFRYINVDLNFSQETYAILASFVFTVFFSGISLFAGSVADKYPRNLIAIIGCTVWSIATALEALTTNVWSFGLLRAVVGASQAFYNPAAYTLLADSFPKRLIARINGIFTSGIYLGGGLASLSIILDGYIGWRSTLLAISSFGLIAIAGCLLFVKENRISRENSNKTTVIAVEAPESIPYETSISKSIESVQVVLRSPEARYIFLAATLRYSAGFCIGVWKAPFVFAKFPGSENLFSGTNAIVVAAGGLLSSVIGGYISDMLANPQDGKEAVARAWVPAVGSILAVPAWILFIRAPTPELSVAFLFAEYIFAECWFGPTLASLFNAVPRESRGTAQSVFSVLTAAGNIAPILVGALVGGELGVSLSIGDALQWAVGGSYFLSGLLFAKVAIMEDNKNQNRLLLEK